MTNLDIRPRQNLGGTIEKDIDCLEQSASTDLVFKTSAGGGSQAIRRMLGKS